MKFIGRRGVTYQESLQFPFEWKFHFQFKPRDAIFVACYWLVERFRWPFCLTKVQLNLMGTFFRISSHGTSIDIFIEEKISLSTAFKAIFSLFIDTRHHQRGEAQFQEQRKSRKKRRKKEKTQNRTELISGEKCSSRQAKERSSCVQIYKCRSHFGHAICTIKREINKREEMAVNGLAACINLSLTHASTDRECEN